MAGENVLVIDDSPTLMRLFARSLSRAGYRVRLAEGGTRGVSLARESRPDLILLDHVMPGLSGEEVFRLLGQEPSLRDVPVVLMSTRGERGGERLAEALGAAALWIKPFSPETLLAQADRIVRKYVRGGTPAPRPAGVPPPPTSPREPASRAERIARLRAELRSRILEAIARGAPTEALTVTPELARALDTGLSDEALIGLCRVALATFPECAHEGAVPLRCDLGSVGLAETAQVLQLQRQTGVLHIVQDRARVEVYFRDGRVDWVGGRNLREEFLLGRFIIDTQAISAQDLDLFLRSRSGSRKLLGAQLVKLGYIMPEDLGAALREQSREIVYEALRWRAGHAYFHRTEERPEHVADARLDMSVDDILQDGFQRLDDWAAIESAIHSFEIVFARNEDALVAHGVEALSQEELVVLELVDGQNSVRQIVDRARMSSFAVGQLLLRLLSQRLVRKKVEPALP